MSLTYLFPLQSLRFFSEILEPESVDLDIKYVHSSILVAQFFCFLCVCIKGLSTMFWQVELQMARASSGKVQL